jgi:hypothetical protein
MTDAKAQAITGNADDNRSPFFIGRRGCLWGEWVSSPPNPKSQRRSRAQKSGARQ